jgi:hypothetical protein
MKTVLPALLFPALLVVVLFGGLYVYARVMDLMRASNLAGWSEPWRSMRARLLPLPTQKVWRIHANNKRPK